MALRVIVPPAPIVSPADIPGSHASNDAAVARAIAAATRTIDGPSGWLGRALGPQTLEYRGNCLPCRLPLRPIIEVEAATVDGETVDLPVWREDGTLAWPAGARGGDVVVNYRAGYNGTSVAEGGTGNVPPEAIDAIILLVQDRLRVGALDAGRRSETVEGIGATTYLDADRFSDLAQRAASNLLSGLRVYA